jgi:hypothetical protein
VYAEPPRPSWLRYSPIVEPEKPDPRLDPTTYRPTPSMWREAGWRTAGWALVIVLGSLVAGPYVMAWLS